MILPRAVELVGRADELVARYTSNRCYYNGYYQTCRRSGWSRFGRWVLAGILIVLALIVLAILLCCLARRRKRSRTTAAPTGYNNTPMTNQQNQYAPPPGAPYGQNPPYGQNNAGYGGQQSGVAAPGNTYYPPK